MNFKVIPLLLLSLLSFSTTALAENRDAFFKFELGAKHEMASDVKQSVDATDGTTVGTDGEITLLGDSFLAGTKIHENMYLLPAVFGDTPTIRAEVSYYDSGLAKFDEVEYNGPPNAWINIDGTVSSINFANAIYTPKYSSTHYAAGIYLTGTPATFTPEAGLVFKVYD